VTGGRGRVSLGGVDIERLVRLIDKRYGDQVRLEQERIPFRWAARRLREVVEAQ
jgi:hypothetical protein